MLDILRYSGRLFQTAGPDTVKAHRPYVESLTGGGTTSLLLLEDLSELSLVGLALDLKPSSFIAMTLLVRSSDP